MMLTERPTHVLLPKSTGLYHCAKMLVGRTKLKKLLDITVGYSGLQASQVPYYEYLIEDVFVKGKYPKKIHMHIKSFDWDTIPGFSGSDLEKYDEKTREDFNIWLRKRFMEKDKLVMQFYENHKFPASNSLIVPISPSWTDIFSVLFIWISVFWMCPLYWHAALWIAQKIHLA